MIRLLLTYGVYLNYNNNFRLLFVLFYLFSRWDYFIILLQKIENLLHFPKTFGGIF